jgi:hypothetical protein
MQLPAWMRSTTAAAIAVTIAVPGAALARPADVNVVNTSPIAVDVSGPVKIDPSQNTVQVGGQPIKTTQAPFHKYVFVPAPSAAGGKSCVAFDIPAGQDARVDTITVTTFNDAGAVAYIRFFAKEASSTSRILVQRILTQAVGSDPVANSRSGIQAWGAHIAGGNVFDVQVGEFHSLNACIQSSAGQSATGAFGLDGVSE